MKPVYIIGTLDTKQPEILYARQCVAELGVPTFVVDVGIFPASEDIVPSEVIHLREERLDLFENTKDRGKALADMSNLLENFLLENVDSIGAVLGLGGSGNTALVTYGMRALPVGLPKMMVSTVASGDISPYVGATDLSMMPSVADVQGINSITRKIIGNAAHAVAGMAAHPVANVQGGKPLVGMSMFGVTTPCVQKLCSMLGNEYEPLVFHATGTGGKALEKLIDSGMIKHVMDITLTEICDLFMGGVMSAGDDRLGAVIRTSVPYVGSVGALDMVNFAAMPTVPEKYRSRNLYVHNANVTLMRTTPEENAAMGEWIGKRLNQCNGKVRFLLPEGGVSAIDAEGMPFHSPEADVALFSAIERTVVQTADRKLIKVPYHINSPEFAQAAVDAFREINN